MATLKEYVNANWNPSIPRECTREDVEMHDCMTQGLDEICESCREYNRIHREFSRAGGEEPSNGL